MVALGGRLYWRTSIYHRTIQHTVCLSVHCTCRTVDMSIVYAADSLCLSRYSLGSLSLLSITTTTTTERVADLCAYHRCRSIAGSNRGRILNSLAIGCFTRSFTPYNWVKRHQRRKNLSKVLFIIPLQYLFAIGFRMHTFEKDLWIGVIWHTNVWYGILHNQYLVFGVSLPPENLHCSLKQYDS